MPGRPRCAHAAPSSRPHGRRAFDAYRTAEPELAALFERVMSGELPDGWEDALPTFGPDDKPATRAASGTVLNAIAARVPELVQGAADLSSSTDTTFKAFGPVTPDDKSGRNIYFGVREHAMGAMVNGMVLHGGLGAVGSTFLQFFDYMKNTVRLAALMEIGSIFVYTHDSIALSEAAPPHQPIEHLAALEPSPGASPCARPTATKPPRPGRSHWSAPKARPSWSSPARDCRRCPAHRNVERGAWVVADGDDCTLIATGSEVSLALAARDELATRNITARVVSMPSWELFDAQDGDYLDEILPDGPPRIAIEAAATFGWERWADIVIGIDKLRGLGARSGPHGGVRIDGRSDRRRHNVAAR